MATLIPADSDQVVRLVLPLNGRDFQLSQLYALLECQMIEIVNLPDGRLLVCDEESKLVNKPRNERATRLAGFVTPEQVQEEHDRMRKSGIVVIDARVDAPDLRAGESDYISGDVLLCDAREVQ